MAFTGQLGLAVSRPGNIVPGLGSAEGDGVTWEGPFTPGELIGGGVLAARVDEGKRIVVPPRVASQMEASDPGWWVFG